MSTIYFITRSFTNVGTSSGGGALARQAQVDVLRACGYNVKVVVPNPDGPTYEENDIVYIGFKRYKKFWSGLEKIGIIGDAFYPWVLAIHKYLRTRVTVADYIMSVTGGSLDTFLVGKKLKESNGCKLILSYHDPINYTTFNGLVVNKQYIFKKDHFEKNMLASADLIFTSSNTFKAALIKKYPFISNRIHNFYFGYNDPQSTDSKTFQYPLNIAYAGSFNVHQSPEILHKVAHNITNYNMLFLGYYQNYEPIKPFINEKEFLGSLDHKTFLKFAKEKIDIGFVSLTNNYLAACFPSKIFEYINLGLPILGALPNSDAMDFINQNGIGKAFHFTEIEAMQDYLKHLTLEELAVQREKVLKLKEQLYFKETLGGMCEQIKNLS